MRADIKTSEFLLTQWGIWAYYNRGLALYFPGIEPFAKMGPSPASGLCIRDAEAEQVDRAVARLKLLSAAEYDALARHYLARQPFRKIARAHGHRNHKLVAHQVANGRRFVEGVLLGGEIRG